MNCAIYKLSTRGVPQECFDFWMFLDALWHCITSKSGLSVSLLSDAMVSDAVQLSVSQQTDLLLIFGAKGCRASWVANNSLQVEFCFISYTLEFLKHIYSLSPLKNRANKAWLLLLHDYVIIAPEEIETVGTW